MIFCMSASLVSSGVSTVSTRQAQAFPMLDANEIARARRFGEKRHYAAGDAVYEAGYGQGLMHLVLSGHIRITARDAHGSEVRVTTHGPGQFTGELGALSGRPALVDAAAIDAVETIVYLPAQVRALLIAEAELGEKIMRALILRRVSLIENGFGGPMLVGPTLHPDVARLRSFLSRNGIPHMQSRCTRPWRRFITARVPPAASSSSMRVVPLGRTAHNKGTIGPRRS